MEKKQRFVDASSGHVPLVIFFHILLGSSSSITYKIAFAYAVIVFSLDDHGNLNDHGNPKLNLILGNNC